MDLSQGISARRQYDALDLMKFIVSIMIVAMHSKALSGAGSAAQFWLCQIPARIGVPFFFITSSFLLFSKHPEPNRCLDKKSFQHFVKRILSLYGFWFCVNLPWIFYVRIYEKGLSLQTVESFIKQALFSSTFKGSWYLMSTVFSACFIYWLGKKLSTSKLLALSFLVYAFCISTSAYSGLLNAEFLQTVKTVFVFPPNSILAGVFYFTLGKWIAEHQDALFRISRKWDLGLIFLFSIIAYVEIYLLKSANVLGETDCFVSLIPLSIFLFLFLCTSHVRIPRCATLRKASTVIYCLHGMCIPAVGFLSTALGFQDYFLIRFLMIIAICLLATFVILQLEKIPAFRWLRVAH